MRIRPTVHLKLLRNLRAYYRNLATLTTLPPISTTNGLTEDINPLSTSESPSPSLCAAGTSATGSPQSSSTGLPKPPLASATDIGKALSLINHGSQHHNSLSTFLSYASRTNLSSTSTVYIGTHYEYTVATSLVRLGFTLVRVGRTSDCGIDLLGTWTLPSHPEPLRVLVQCKARRAGVGPCNVRELEGAFTGAPPRWRGEGVLGLLVGSTRASKGVRETVGKNRWPIGYAAVGKDGRVEQLMWNQVADFWGLEGIGVVTRYRDGRIVDSADKRGDEVFVKDVALTWNGWVFERGEEPESPARVQQEEKPAVENRTSVKRASRKKTVSLEAKKEAKGSTSQAKKKTVAVKIKSKSVRKTGLQSVKSTASSAPKRKRRIVNDRAEAVPAKVTTATTERFTKDTNKPES